MLRSKNAARLPEFKPQTAGCESIRSSRSAHRAALLAEGPFVTSPTGDDTQDREPLARDGVNVEANAIQFQSVPRSSNELLLR
jgi:hypothetical protein